MKHDWYDYKEIRNKRHKDTQDKYRYMVWIVRYVFSNGDEITLKCNSNNKQNHKSILTKSTNTICYVMTHKVKQPISHKKGSRGKRRKNSRKRKRRKKKKRKKSRRFRWSQQQLSFYFYRRALSRYIHNVFFYVRYYVYDKADERR